jgi:hypothetical protein
VTFLRHLAAASLTVAVVVALGVVWAHGSGNSLAGGHRVAAGSPAAIAAQRRIRALHGKVIDGRIVIPGHSRQVGGFNLANVQDLTRTAVLEAVFIVVVVTASAARRRRRTRRRRALSGASPA